MVPAGLPRVRTTAAKRPPTTTTIAAKPVSALPSFPPRRPYARRRRLFGLPCRHPGPSNGVRRLLDDVKAASPTRVHHLVHKVATPRIVSEWSLTYKPPDCIVSLPCSFVCACGWLTWLALAWVGVLVTQLLYDGMEYLDWDWDWSGLGL